jgi:predicted nucleotidyltransferase
MANKTYTITEIKHLIYPIAQRYGVERVLLFGSYARGVPTPDSDIDLRIDRGAIQDYFELSGFHQEIEEALATSVDVLTTGSLEDKFLLRIADEEVVLYEQPQH